jgi:hypothetical protein
MVSYYTIIIPERPDSESYYLTPTWVSLDTESLDCWQMQM